MEQFFPIEWQYKKWEALKILKENLHKDYLKNLELKETTEDWEFWISITQKEYSSDKKNLEATECYNYVSWLDINDIIKNNK